MATVLAVCAGIYLWAHQTKPEMPSVKALQTFALTQENQMPPVIVQDLPMAKYDTYAGVGCITAPSHREAYASLATYVSSVPEHVKTSILSRALPTNCTDTSATIETQHNSANGTELVLAFWHTTCDAFSGEITSCVSISGSLVQPEDRTVGTIIKKTTTVVGFEGCRCIGGLFCQSCPLTSETEEHVPLKQPTRLTIAEHLQLERVTKTNAIQRIRNLVTSLPDYDANLLTSLSNNALGIFPQKTIAESA